MLLVLASVIIYVTDAKFLCSTSVGIDVSHHNKLNKKDWDDLKKHNVKFVYIKASQGVSYKDPMRYIHTNNAERNGIKYGYYHFFEDNVSPKKQIDNFCNSCGNKDLVSVIDYEPKGFHKNVSFKTRVKRLCQWIDYYYNETKEYPIIYCNPLDAILIKPFVPKQCKFWIGGSCGLGTISQFIKSYRGSELDFDYCRNIPFTEIYDD